MVIPGTEVEAREPVRMLPEVYEAILRARRQGRRVWRSGDHHHVVDGKRMTTTEFMYLWGVDGTQANATVVECSKT